MSDAAAPSRSYDSSLRRRPQRPRHSVIEAARDLFLKQGYAATIVEITA